MTIGALIVIFSFILGYKATVSPHAHQGDMQADAPEVSLSANTRELIALVTFRKNEIKNAFDAIKNDIQTKPGFIERPPGKLFEDSTDRAIKTVRT